MKPTKAILVQALADEFSVMIRGYMTSEQIREAIRRNEMDEYVHRCATHDFCDPNQAMIDAMSVLGYDYNDLDARIVNQAWDIARDRKFKPERKKS